MISHLKKKDLYKYRYLIYHFRYANNWSTSGNVKFCPKVVQTGTFPDQIDVLIYDMKKSRILPILCKSDPLKTQFWYAWCPCLWVELPAMLNLFFSKQFMGPLLENTLILGPAFNLPKGFLIKWRGANLGQLYIRI